MGKRLFISKNASDIEPYREQLEAKGYSVVAHSFLSFSSVFFTVPRDYDVIFFGSPRAVAFFTDVQSIPDSVKIGCVGSKTAGVVESLGYTVDFVGTKSSEPRLVAEEFKVWLTSTPLSQRASRAQGESLNPRVLFPISDRSLKTISSVIDDDLKEEVVVYSTDVKGCVIEECDVYVFSSPSNVEGFLINNQIPKASKVIAWGTSTEKASRERGIDTITLNLSSINELLNTI